MPTALADNVLAILRTIDADPVDDVARDNDTRLMIVATALDDAVRRNDIDLMNDAAPALVVCIALLICRVNDADATELAVKVTG